MQTGNTIWTPGVRSTFVYDNGVQTSSRIETDANSRASKFSVPIQKTGIPNMPTVNELSWSKHKYSTFLGARRNYRSPFGDRSLGSETVGCDVAQGATPPLPSFNPNGSADRQALSRLYAKLRDSKACLAVDIAEGGQTVRMVQGAVDRVLTFARRLRRHPLDTLSSAWLEYQYGWRPALQTIYDVANFSRNNLLSRAVKASAIERGPISAILPTGYYQSKVSGNFLYSVTYGCRLNIKNNLLYDVQRLTSLNPLTVAWELVPYSFVIDWFYDIGGFLDDLETSSSMGHLVSNVYKTTHAIETTNHTIDNERYSYLLDNGNTLTRETVKASAFYQMIEHHRYPLNGLPTPYMPRFDTHLGASRILSGAALLTQFFRR